MARLPSRNAIGRANYFTRERKCAGATIAELRRLEELEAQDSRLKRMYAELALDRAATQGARH